MRTVSVKRKTVQFNELPAWANWVLASAFALMLCVAAYFIVIRPYSYRWKPCNGMKEYKVCIPLETRILGIDISHHQGFIDWELMMQPSEMHPVRFVFMKATEGGDFKDENFDDNFEAAGTAGVARGAYLFYNPESTPESQAAFFIENVRLAKGDLPPVIDIERSVRSSDMSKLRGDLLECMRLLEDHYGVKPIIYSSYKYWKNCLNAPDFGDCPFWIAHYYVEKLDDKAVWTFWQFTDRGHVPGIRGYTDLNLFNGDEAEFGEFLLK